MSSSSLVSLTYKKETDGYGVRPPSLGAVTLKTARFTTESLSGTPTTSESQEIRTDRMSPGQQVMGLDVMGAINFELAQDDFFDDFFEAGMLSAWVADEIVNTTVDLVPIDSQSATLTLGAEFANLVPGTLAMFTPAGSSIPVVVQITTVDTPSTVFTVATKKDQAVVSDTLDIKIPQHADIGRDVLSILIGKAYLDVLDGGSQKSQTYAGEYVSSFSVNATWGERITGAFNMMGNGYLQETPSLQQQVVSAGGTVAAAGTANALNASVDVPLVTIDDAATDFCIRAFNVTLNNGLDPKTCIGSSAPRDYTLGTASVAVTMDVYNSKAAYEALMPKKALQTPFSLTYVSINVDGGYAFRIDSLQVSFPDPASGGQNQSVFINAEGVGKVGENGESALRIYSLK